MEETLFAPYPSDIRTESDSLGVVDVPRSAYYGAQTARAIDNFQISGIRIGQYPFFIGLLLWSRRLPREPTTSLAICPKRR